MKLANKPNRFNRGFLLLLYIAIPISVIVLAFSKSSSDAIIPIKKEIQQLQNKIDPPRQISWLKTSGNQVVDDQGKHIILRGVNVPSIEWQQGNWNTKAVRHAASKWKVNVIRTRVNQTAFLKNPNKVLDQLETQILHPARRLGLYVILDPKFDHNRPLPDSGTISMWRQLAERYQDDPHILFDLLSEPHDVSHSTVYQAYESLIPQIRNTHPRSLIFVTGTGWGRAINPYLTNPLPYDNLVYRSNPYNRSGEFSGLFGQLADKYPVFLAEFGADGHPPMSRQSVSDLLVYADQLGLGWTAWVFSADGCPCLLENNNSLEPSDYGKIVLNHLLQQIAPTSPKQTFTEFMAEEEKGFTIYDDALQHAFNDLSWDTEVDLQHTKFTYSGKHSIQATLTPKTGLYLYTWIPITPTPNQSLSFYLFTDNNRPLNASIWLKDDKDNNLVITALASHTTPATKGWFFVSIPMTTLNPESKTISGFTISNFTQPIPNTIYLDEIRLPTN